VRAALADIADAEVQASLGHLTTPSAPAAPDAGQEPATVSVGPPTAQGSRFRILRPHAQGGLGEVFLAHDEELHRQVALKQMQERHADDPSSRARFLVEAEITGGLEHPGIGEEKGTPYFSEYAKVRGVQTGHSMASTWASALGRP
jgi:hypothetical protein